MSASYLLLKICILILPELDVPLSVEQPSFDGLEALLVLGAPDTVAIKVTTSVTHASIYRLGSFLEKLS